MYLNELNRLLRRQMMSDRSDLLDDANLEIERRLQKSIAEHKAKLKPSGKLFCSCGEPIGVARLAAYPAATKCIDCAKLGERR
jgi:RNA polymerase-binding transcription factor DksA